MDGTIRAMAAYVHDADFASLDATSVARVKQHLLDALGCVFGGMSSDASRVSAALAEEVTARAPATVFGSGARSAPDYAAFANAVMLRQLDFNDAYLFRGGCHPSDSIAALLAAAEVAQASGSDFLNSIVVAYEILGSILSSVSIRERGWDQGSVISIAVAAACSRLLGGTVEQTENAIAIAAVAGISARHTRAGGALSNWKGCATAEAGREGLFAAELAVRGITGPPAAIEGRHGFFDQVTGPLDLEFPMGQRPAIELVNLKFYPAEYHAQAVLDILAQMRPALPGKGGAVDTDQLSEILVETYETAADEIASTPAHWAPQTRETADHSMPYLMAVMIRDGRIGLDSFGPADLDDRVIKALIGRTRVVVDERFTAEFPERCASRITCRLADGRVVISEEASFGRGHARNPMTDGDVKEKFLSMALQLLPEDQALRITECVAELDLASSVDELLTLMTVPSKAGESHQLAESTR